jgi:hypothetical protein
MVKLFHEIKKDEIGGACSMCGGRKVKRILMEKLKGRHNVEDHGVDGTIILDFLKK